MTSQVAITLLKSLEQSLDSYCELNDEGKTAFSMAISALELFGNSEQLPSVQPRKGKWIIYSTFDDSYYAKCDQCHETQVFYYNKPLTNFCPNCGCRMEEGGSE